MSVTRKALCTVKGCPAPASAEWHVCWLRGHGECFGGISHQHTVKRSRGGKVIDACLCIGHHDRIDNGDWGNKLYEDGDGRWWIAYDEDQNILERKLIAPPWWLNGSGPESGAGESVSLPVGRPPSAPLPVPELADVHEWGRTLVALNQQRGALSLTVALLLRDGLARFGEEAWHYISEAGMEKHSVDTALSVVNGLPKEVLDTYVRKVSWSVLAVVAPVYRRSAEDGERLLLEAAESKATVEEVRAAKSEMGYGRVKSESGAGASVSALEPPSPVPAPLSAFNVEDLRYYASGPWPGKLDHRNNGPRYLAAFIDSLSAPAPAPPPSPSPSPSPPPAPPPTPTHFESLK